MLSQMLTLFLSAAPPAAAVAVLPIDSPVCTGARAKGMRGRVLDKDGHPVRAAIYLTHGALEGDRLVQQDTGVVLETDKDGRFSSERPVPSKSDLVWLDVVLGGIGGETLGLRLAFEMPSCVLVRLTEKWAMPALQKFD